MDHSESAKMLILRRTFHPFGDEEHSKKIEINRKVQVITSPDTYKCDLCIAGDLLSFCNNVLIDILNYLFRVQGGPRGADPPLLLKFSS